ncbi:MAG: 3-methyladenine DNA glycosylase [Legionellales bacterium]|nr:3-methyladenine DNA glycosylase [Legionellales bacterium]|tara:strand:+ start:448 stop:1116 length:669 start_codon:yes stop_codon:yes gene_type:complete
MQKFETIYGMAADLEGGVEALEALLPIPRTEKELKNLTNSFCLSNMSRRIFQAGLNRKIIDNKWPSFEDVFHQFDINAVRMLSDEVLQALMDEKRIVRHWGKIQSVRHNAQTIYEIDEEEDGFLNYVAEWPSSEIVEFWDVLKKRFKQLGGASGPYFLRRIKKDTFLLTQDVMRAMARWGAIDEEPKNKKQMNHVQECMNLWQEESQRPYCQLSMILACSID